VEGAVDLATSIRGHTAMGLLNLSGIRASLSVSNLIREQDWNGGRNCHSLLHEGSYRSDFAKYQRYDGVLQHF
jgi:hypothetical protein